MSKFAGTVEEIVFRNDANGWTVASFRIDGSSKISAVGILPFLAAGERAVLDGELAEHRDYGQQIKVSSYELLRPETKTGVEKYLGSGLVKGVGPATAKQIVGHFGVNTLDILESEPERLSEIPGIGPKRAAMIAESFALQNGMRNTMIFLQNAGLSATLSLKIYRAFGDQSETVLRKNPYRLADEIEGVGFQTADRIARGLGFQPENESRLMSGVAYVLTEAVNRMGHTYLPCAKLQARAVEILGVAEELVTHTIDALVLSKRLIREQIESETAVYLPRMHELECDTAQLFVNLRDSKTRISVSREDAEAGVDRFEADAGVHLCEGQRQAVLRAVTGSLTIITGGPGTGKTTSLNCILRLLEGHGTTELCAPTGRAARRMSDATGRPARTIHRLLEYTGEAGGFARDEENPLAADTVIVDEMSMVDLFLMRSLLRALRPGTRLVLVGDADQLPSVGAGNVLKDLIAAQAAPVVCLEEIFRQAQQSAIITNAHRINHGVYPELRTHDTDFFIERRDSAQQAAQSVVALVEKRLPGYLQLDSLKGIQVMAPMKKGPLGVIELNALLQSALNPPAREKAELVRGDCVFRLGDKVMQVRNDYDLEWTRGSERGDGVFNGDIGFIVHLSRSERELRVEFDDGRCADYDDTMLDELELSYCISVHKSQGSEFEAVVLPLISGPQMLLTRNLLYTAVTRARRLVVIVGRETCVRQMVDNNHIQHRYSALKQRLWQADRR